MAAETLSPRIAASLLCVAAASMARPLPAAAFPTTDPLNPSVVPVGGDLAAPDARDLQHQLGLLSGFASAGAGWTILPRLTLEEEVTDNALQLNSPRKWDLIHSVFPGVAIQGDTARVQLRLDYEPQLQLYTENGSQSALTQQLNTDGLITIVPDLFFLDLRGVAGVQATAGGIGGVGGLGASSVGPIGAGSIANGTQLGLARDNRTQTSGFTASPYLLYHFGDIGDGRLGLSLNRSNSSPVSGFAPSPFTSGNGGQELTSVEETASFQSGPILTRFNDTVSINLEQSRSTGTSDFLPSTTSQVQSFSSTSRRDIFDNRVDYAYSHSLSFYLRLGYENITYSGPNGLDSHGVTWQVGTTFSPNDDSQITVGYGFEDNTTSLTFDGHYALTARTTLTGSYHAGTGTQLEQLRNQLNNGSVANNGGLVNSQTGGPLFNNLNAVGQNNGLYRFTNASVGVNTVLARDTFQEVFTYTTNTQTGRGTSGGESSVKSASVAWTHAFNPDLSGTGSVYYSVGSTLVGASNSNSIAFQLSGQYVLSDTVTAFARYSFYQRSGGSTLQNYYQDLVILGVTKQF